MKIIHPALALVSFLIMLLASCAPIPSETVVPVNGKRLCPANYRYVERTQRCHLTTHPNQIKGN